LSPGVCIACFGSVPTQPSTPAVVIGSVAASATTGALVAMGHRLGSAAAPFAAIGAALVRRTPTVSDTTLIVIGVVLHVTMVLVWSAVFVWLVRDARWRNVAAAITVALGAFLLSGVIASLSGAGAATLLPLGDRVVLAVVLAAALVLGMRFAFSPREMHD
jgi:uncharacterized membrane protein SirB2